MDTDTMRFEDFETLVALYGMDPARWPTPSLAERADVGEWLRRERELDAALGASLPLSANFGDRVVAKLPRDERRTPWWIGGAVAATLVAGVVFMQPSAPSDAAPDLQAEAWEAMADEAGFADLYAWVEGDA